MSKLKKTPEGRAPFTRDEIIRDVRIAILAMASLIANLGPRKDCLKVAEDYVGVALDDYCRNIEGHSQLDLIPVEEHQLYTVVMDAFDYAYQLGDPTDYDFSVETRAYEVGGILTAFPVCDFDGEPSPLDRLNPQKLRQVLETFEARWALDQGRDLSVSQLALLANMGEAAVRTSLSAEGIRTITRTGKGEKNQVPHADALVWLMGRRGFVPSRNNVEGSMTSRDLVLSAFLSESLSFEAALKKATSALEKTTSDLATEGGLSVSWMRDLADPDVCAPIDLPALQRLADLLEVPVPLFVGRAVSALLERQLNKDDGSA